LACCKKGVDSDAADKLVDLIRNEFVNGDVSSFGASDDTIRLVKAEEFAYTDPVDGSVASGQGLILSFEINNDPARVVFRLSGTGSSGATIRMYLEKFEKDTSKHSTSAPIALKDLADKAIELVRMQELTGLDAPTVVT
jgi:phosphoglucomutase